MWGGASGPGRRRRAIAKRVRQNGTGNVFGGAGRGPELVWPGKYDARGRPRAPRRIAAPIRLLERHGEEAAAEPAPWRNLLLAGDNLLALGALAERLAGAFDLIYLDPPFATGSRFFFQGEVGAAGGGPSRVAREAYRDGWGEGRAAWFSLMYERLALMRDLLSERGTIYVHVDWAVGHHLRPVLDEVFGEQSSLGEIIWAYGSPSGGRAAGRKLVKAHDLIFAYARSYGRHRFRPVYLPYSEKYVRNWFKFEDEEGRRYRKRWRRDASGSSYVERQYLDESPGVPASTVWTDIQQVYADPRAYKAGARSEISGYPTQKPVRLLERLIEISTEPGDLVADFFCGSGTTLVAAERMGRRWVGCDGGRLAIHTARRRLLEMEGCRPFDILDFGSVGRRLGRDAAAQSAARLRARVLEAHGATPLARGEPGVHGRLENALVHVGSVACAIDRKAVLRAVESCLSVGNSELHVLGWEWDEAPEKLEAEAEARGVRLVPFVIGCETAAPGEPGVSITEVPRVELELLREGGQIAVRLSGFEFRLLARLPEQVRARVDQWSDYVELWSVDWDHHGDAFVAHWRSVRTRGDRRLELTSAFREWPARRCLVAAMVVDVFGNSTLRRLEATVGP